MPYLTPKTTPTTSRCRRIFLPDDERSLAAFLGQLIELKDHWNWEQTDGISVEDTTNLFQEVFDKFSVGDYCMIGALVHYVTLTPPNGILKCDGTQYLRVDYPELYANLPPSLIVDPDNFIVPTIEDEFVLSAGTTYPPETVGGEIDHILTVSELAAHGHNSNYPAFTLSIKTVGAPNIESGSNPPVLVPTSSVGNDEGHNNMPPFYAANVGIVAL